MSDSALTEEESGILPFPALIQRLKVNESHCARHIRHESGCLPTEASKLQVALFCEIQQKTDDSTVRRQPGGSGKFLLPEEVCNKAVEIPGARPEKG